MPIIRDIHLTLNIKEVLRWQGYREHSKIRPEIKNLILELLASVKSDHLLEPAAAYEIHSIKDVGHRQLSLTGKTLLRGLRLPILLTEVKDLAAVVCTIGPRLEKQSVDCFSRNEPLRGVLLDGIGNAAIVSLVHEVCKRITSEALSRGYQASSAFNPGMDGLPISAQWQLFKLARAENIGVSLTASGLMIPGKSSSMIIGLGPQIQGRARSETCTRCSLKSSCPYRIPVSTKYQDITRA